MASDPYKLSEGRDMLAILGHVHADEYNELDILESLALEGYEWDAGCWCPIADDPPIPPSRKPPEPLDVALRRIGAPRLPGLE